jgi:RluA family pseudouridine synthase
MSKKIVYRVSYFEKEMRLVAFIKDKTRSKLSNREIKRAIEEGVCKVNNRVENFASRKLKENETVELEENWQGSIVKKKIFSPKILFEDEYFVIIDKEEGFICSDEELHQFFPSNYLLVHRLDKDTSGVLIVAKSLSIKKKMVELFTQKLVKKTYVAVVDGEVKEKKGKISSYLVKKNSHGKILYMATKNQGQFALTLYETIKKAKNYSVLKCFPVTGRTHQIRVHMLQINHPILGDYQYFQNYKYPFFVKRVMLHSLLVEFDHPITKNKVVVRADLPSEFEKF